MIPNIYVERQIKKLEQLYNQASLGTDPDLPKLYSKLAVMELCSWTEECMDSIILGMIKRRRLKEKQNLDIVALYIKKTFGFDFDYHFRQMLYKTMGIVDLERLEKKMDSIKIQKLKGALSQLKPERDSHAHETIRTAKTFTAPSVCLQLFYDIKDGLNEYNIWIGRLRLGSFQ